MIRTTLTGICDCVIWFRAITPADPLNGGSEKNFACTKKVGFRHIEQYTTSTALSSPLLDMGLNLERRFWPTIPTKQANRFSIMFVSNFPSRCTDFILRSLFSYLLPTTPTGWTGGVTLCIINRSPHGSRNNHFHDYQIWKLALINIINCNWIGSIVVQC